MSPAVRALLIAGLTSYENLTHDGASLYASVPPPAPLPMMMTS